MAAIGEATLCGLVLPGVIIMWCNPGPASPCNGRDHPFTIILLSLPSATLFGHGVYFAVEATISARDRYSPPSSDGHKYILVAHVLTGEFALGKEDMRMPPVKPDSGDVPQRYDSLADNLQNPSIFVIFNDTQAYPQYLITCCSTSDGGK